MANAVTAAAIVRPSDLRNGVPTFAVDEDPFTLAVAAAGRLPETGGSNGTKVGEIHLVGEFPPMVSWAFPEAVGWDVGDVRVHPPTLEGFLNALRLASSSPVSRGAGAVVAVERVEASSSPRNADRSRGAISVAVRLSDGPGLRLVAETVHHATPHGTPAVPPLTAALARLGVAPQDRSDLVVRYLAGAGEPRELEKDPSAPSVAVQNVDPGSPTAAGSIASYVHAALGPVAPGEDGDGLVVLRIDSGTSWAAHFRTDGPVALVAPPSPTNSSTAPPYDDVTSAETSAVSEGAYVPHPRYVEDLPSRWRLMADRCGTCHRLTFPSRGGCRWCGESKSLSLESLPRSGVVEASTTVAPGAQPTEFDWLVRRSGSYQVVLVRLHPDVRATFQVTSPTRAPLTVGSRVTAVLRRLYPMEGEWRYGLKAVAAEPAEPMNHLEAGPRVPA